MDRAVPARRIADPHSGLVDLPGGPEYAARGARARPRRDIDDPVFEFRQGSRSGARFAPGLAFLRPDPDRVSYRQVWPGAPGRPRRGGLRGSMGTVLRWVVAIKMAASPPRPRYD